MDKCCAKTGCCTCPTLELDAEDEAQGVDHDMELWLWRTVADVDTLGTEGVQPDTNCVIKAQSVTALALMLVPERVSSGAEAVETLGPAV